MSFNRNRTTICSSAANAFLVYLEPRERVWWLQMPFSPLGKLTSLPQILSWIWGATLRQGKERSREGREGKGKKERDGRDGRKTPTLEINLWIRLWVELTMRLSELDTVAYDLYRIPCRLSVVPLNISTADLLCKFIVLPNILIVICMQNCVFCVHTGWHIYLIIST